MKYYITYKIDAKYVAEVEADSIDEAIEIANEEFFEADFGDAEDIDGKVVMTECDNNGDISAVKTRYYVCGIGYDEDDCVTYYEQSFGGFDAYTEAYELFVKLQCRDTDTFFVMAPSVHRLLIQLEECKETEDEIECIDVKNEWWITNPNFKEE